MSKDIWHRYDEVPRHQDIIMTDAGCWAYRADLLALETELDHTRKALDIAVDKLKSIKTHYDNNYDDPHFVNWHTVAQRLANDADDAIKQITKTKE